MKRFLSFIISVFLALSVCTLVIAKGPNSGKHLVGGSGSSHKGGHYVDGSSSNDSQSHSNYTSKDHSSYSYPEHPSHISEHHRRSYSSDRYISIIHYNHISTTIGVTRDSHGKIERSESAKENFLKKHGYTKVPPGYEVDHIIPLYAGGRDTPDNMQLLTKAQHHNKTKADFKRYGR